MKRFLLIAAVCLLSAWAGAQEAVSPQLSRLAAQADDAAIDGKRKEAGRLYRRLVESCRKGGDAYMLQEFDALYSLNSLEEDIPGKKQLLQEMEERLSAAPAPPHPDILKGYISLVKAEIDRHEGRTDQAFDELKALFGTIFNNEPDPESGKLVKTCAAMQIAENAAESGIYDQALDLFQIAESMLGEPVTRMETMFLGTLVTGQGNACRELNRLDEAGELFSRARKLFDGVKAQKSRHYAYLLINEASLQMSRGLNQEATGQLEQALNLMSEPSIDRGEALVMYAGAQLILGKYDRAESVMKEAGKIATRFSMRPMWWVSYYYIQASLHTVSGRLKKSIEATGEALAIIEREGIVNPQLISGLYRQMCSNYFFLGDEASSKSYERLSEEVLTDIYGETFAADRKKNKKDTPGNSPYDRVGRLMDAIMEDADAGRNTAALEKLDKALEIYRQNGIGGLPYLTVYSLKLTILENEGDTKKLKKAADGYLQELRKDVRLNLSYMTEEERETYYASIMPSVSYAYMTIGDPTLSAQAYNAVLLRKNFLLGAGIGLEKIIADSGDETLQHVLQEMKALRSGPAQDETLPGRERQAASSRADSLENILIRQSHDYGDFLSLSDIRWEDVRNALGPDEVAVEFIISGTPKLPIYCALLLRRGWKRPENIVLCKDEDQMLSALSDPEYYGMVYSEPGLYALFWEPLEEYLKPGDKVYFAMDGFLNAFAFEHFVTDKGDRAMDRFDLHRVSSTRELIGWKKEGKERSAALFGGFDYNLSGEEVAYYASASRDGSSGEWGYLPGSLAEVEAADRILKDRLDVALYTGEEGLESRFKALSGEAPDLIHIATHGYWNQDGDDPMACAGLVFSGANALREEGPAAGEDGLLKASEIALMDLRGTGLIVLSACQSGVGSISSDGVYGLQRAFKKAGVHSILMSLWKVDDQVTADMMQLFYTGLADGKDSREAFRAARETLRKTHPDPLLWAPFVLLES